MGLALVLFAPDTLIEIADTMGGFRKLGFVVDSGMAYIDLVEEGATPFPVYETLEPVAIGNSFQWGLEVLDRRPGEVQAWTSLVHRLLAADLDSLTYNRALWWARQARSYDFAAALDAGLAATGEVRQSREKMDRLIRRGRSSHLQLVV